MGDGAGYIVGAVVVLTLAAFFWRRLALRSLARERLEVAAQVELPPEIEEAVDPAPPRASAGWSFPIAAGLLVGAVLMLVGLAWPIAGALGFVVCCLARMLVERLATRRVLRLDQQVASAADLMFAAMRAGASFVDAVDAAARELPSPLGDGMEMVSARMRLGEPVPEVLADLEDSLPQESVRLLTQTLGVHSGSGASIGPALAAVGRSVRDRVEVTWRFQAQATEVDFSVLAVFGLTWLIAFVSWNGAPERVESFVYSAEGESLLALCVALQGIGILWIGRMRRLVY